MGHGVALIPAALKGRGTTTLNGVLMGGTAILQIASGLLVEGAQAWFGTLSSGYAAFFAALGALMLVGTVMYLRPPEPGVEPPGCTDHRSSAAQTERRTTEERGGGAK